MAKGPVLQVRLDPEQLVRLDAEADAAGVTRSGYARQILTRHLDGPAAAAGRDGSAAALSAPPRSPAKRTEQMIVPRDKRVRTASSSDCPACGAHLPMHQRGCPKNR